MGQGERITIMTGQPNWLVKQRVDIRIFFGSSYPSFQLRVISTGSLMITSGRSPDGDGERDGERCAWSSV